MHLARIKRHGHPGLKEGPSALEKLPHIFIDKFIRKNCKKIIDEQIAKILRKKGFAGATIWTVKYRRRKLGIKKYLYGEVKKHKAWIRAQAIKKYGNKCELCGFKLVVDTHHILPKNKGGLHTIDNLTVLCPNCHALITRRRLPFNKREDLPNLRKKISALLKSF
jgi:5-methylcytosine-specific restriction endonuclease McrA